MTRRTASLEAVRRFGRTGRAWSERSRCYVGTQRYPSPPEVRGEGATWDEAFTRAEGRRWFTKKEVP